MRLKTEPSELGNANHDLKTANLETLMHPGAEELTQKEKMPITKGGK